MSRGSWLRTRRKQIITHTLIVGAFLLFLFFLSGPLFDRFEFGRIPGEAPLADISVPAETGNITYWLESIVAGPVVEFLGCAFIEGEYSENSTSYLVFKSDQATYVFEAAMQEIGTLNQMLGIEEPDLIKAGFIATIPAERMENGTYTIGIYIRKGATEALQYTDKVLTRTNEVIELRGE
ncbi:MAG: hypothetical protein ACFFH0_13025 [Promethearchaeota archaeon]